MRPSSLVLSLLLAGCATHTPLNAELSSRGVALVKDSVFVPLVSPTSATLAAIDGHKTNYLSSSREVPAGVHTFFVVCSYFLSTIQEYHGNSTLEVTLEAGRTYKLIPVVPNPRSNTCESVLKDETTSN